MFLQMLVCAVPSCVVFRADSVHLGAVAWGSLASLGGCSGFLFGLVPVAWILLVGAYVSLRSSLLQVGAASPRTGGLFLHVSQSLQDTRQALRPAQGTKRLLTAPSPVAMSHKMLLGLSHADFSKLSKFQKNKNSQIWTFNFLFKAIPAAIRHRSF